MKVKLYGINNEFLESLEIEERDNSYKRFLLYRGRLFERVLGSKNYLQRNYVEIC